MTFLTIVDMVVYISYFFAFLIPYILLGFIFLHLFKDSTYDVKDYYMTIFLYPVLFILYLIDERRE